jgi:O-antigen/teichoic acid export membrane protein
MLGISLWAVLLATVVQFIVGMIWYMPVFGKLWGKIHGFDKITKEKQKEMMSQMGPYYFLQLLVTVVTAIVLAKLMALTPDYSVYKLGLFVWVGLCCIRLCILCNICTWDVCLYSVR